jgi:hypothetical protein
VPLAKIALGATATVLAALLVLVGLHVVGVLGSTKTSPVTSTLRHRLDAVEADPFVVALLATPHNTQTSMEDLGCQPDNSAESDWNLQAITSVTDSDAVTATIGRAAELGWRPVASSVDQSSAFVKSLTTKSGPVTVELFVARVGPTLEVDVNASAGLACRGAD